MIRRLVLVLPALLLALLSAQPVRASWTPVTGRGTATEKTSDTSISVSPTATLATGTIQLVVCNTDDDGNGSGDTNAHSLSDSSGNTWTKIKEESGSVAGAGTDVTVSLWMTKITSSISTGGSITCTTANAVTAKAIGIYEFTVASGKTFSVVGTTANTFTAATTDALTLSGLTSAEYLWVGSWGIEGPSGDSYTEDTDYILRLSPGTSGGSAVSNVTALVSTRVFTGTSDTFDGTLGTARDGAKILAAIQEVDEGAPPPAEPPLRRQVITRHSTPGLPAGPSTFAQGGERQSSQK